MRRLALALLLTPAFAHGQSLWVDPDGRPNPASWELIRALADVGQRGLDPADYSAAHWQALASELEGASVGRDSIIAELDQGLTVAFIEALSDLHGGRIDPAALGYQLHLRREAFDPAAIAGRALTSGRIADAFDDAEPRLLQYRHIEVALAQYRILARDSTLVRVPPIRGVTRSGDPLPEAPILRRWLAALGDLPSAGPPASDDVYDESLVRAVRGFQQRRGLDSSGMLDPATVAALRQPVSWYVRRLELALERLRWLPDRDTGQVVVVDIPAFRLWVLDSLRSSAAPTLAMNAIVGQAFGKQTPVLEQTMQSVVFRPYWDVPSPITGREIVPELRRDLNYLAKNDMELVPSTPPGQASAALLAGRARVRQRPGPDNALGLIKFVFPNDRDIYLHSTPAQQLFLRTRRDFSHGCIRLEHPAALAEYVLRGNLGWTLARIDSAMQGTKTFEVELRRSIPVLVFYATAVAWPDGRVAFYPDIYGHDARLDRALRERSAAGAAPDVALRRTDRQGITDSR